MSIICFSDQMLYLRRLNGKINLKSIINAFLPQDNYDQLIVSSGLDIIEMYTKYENNGYPKEIEHELKSYVSKDTYSMVYIVNELKKLAL